MYEGAWYSLIADCGLCDCRFSSNPERVPTFLVDRRRPAGLKRLAVEGTREPVCESCFDAINALRDAHGLARLAALPDAWSPAETA